MPKKSRVPKSVSKFILNCLPSPDTEKDWGITTAAAAGVRAPRAIIPARKDLREKWWTVGNQGDTGSCVGWGTADGVLRWHFVQAGRLSKTESLSVRYVWMAAKETDVDHARPTTFIERDGTWLKAALDIARKLGVVTHAVLPFTNPPRSPALYLAGDANTFYALAAQRRIASYFNLGRNLSDWRAWIANNGPILTRLDVDPTWDNATTTQGNLDVYDAAHARGGTASRWLATRRSVSSCATVGLPRGGTRGSPMHQTRTLRRRSRKRTASPCEAVACEHRCGGHRGWRYLVTAARHAAHGCRRRSREGLSPPRGPSGASREHYAVPAG